MHDEYIAASRSAGAATRARPASADVRGYKVERGSTVRLTALGWSWLMARAGGAVAVLVAGVVHLQEYLGPYGSIRTIGTLFVLNFIAATVIGVSLLSPLEHLAGRAAGAAVAVVTLAGIALTGSSYVLLLISEHGSVFGFHEPGYDPSAISVARNSEIAAVVLLTISLVLRFGTRAPKRRW